MKIRFIAFFLIVHITVLAQPEKKKLEKGIGCYQH